MKRWDTQGLTASQRAILDCLKAIGPMTIQELCAELELSRDGARKAVNELAVALEKARRECNHWHARLLAEVNNRNTKEKT